MRLVRQDRIREAAADNPEEVRRFAADVRELLDEVERDVVTATPADPSYFDCPIPVSLSPGSETPTPERSDSGEFRAQEFLGQRLSASPIILMMLSTADASRFMCVSASIPLNSAARFWLPPLVTETRK
ncbi:hypothetical protein [Streptomyces fuscichromogenes]|uniref:Uncharacterized protein n=1 Tax=Streptomyces fuscichromogenes TaxID=1324013 RepID=A0A918CUL3_9ACTN|nr:hypothetical protein [Streptomyces fuscichromogenes]GGN29950.1 hypothetical protein GCM10011578_066710 [Streptomyces fuscichromogenes]